MKKLIAICIVLCCCQKMLAQTLKVMTYNIHHGANTADKDRLDSIGLFIKGSGADLVALQEVDSVCKRTGYIDQAKRLAEITGMYYAFARHIPFEGGAYGQAILSRYPLSNIQNLRLSLLKKNGKKESRALLSVTAKLPGKSRLRFACAHFALDTASRLVQARESISYLRSRSMPVLLTGDLNTLPDSEEIKILENYFTGSDNEQLLTFPSEGPVKKIDYIFTSKKFPGKIREHQVYNNIRLSDHLPVMATIELKK